jgi:hypothetical protein
MLRSFYLKQPLILSLCHVAIMGKSAEDENYEYM